MYEVLIKEYLKRLSLKDINDFASKNGIVLPNGEDKKIYNFIMKYWKDVYQGNTNQAFNELKQTVSSNTYNVAMALYNEYKDKIK